MKRFALPFGGLLALAGATLVAPSVRADAPPNDSPRAITEAHRITADIDNSARGIAVLLSKARRTGDKRTIACVNETLSEADALRRRARDRSAEIRAYVEHRDATSAERATRALTLLQSDREVSRGIAKEAYACVGLTLHRAGERDVVTVRVFIDKDIPPEDAR